MQERPGAHEVAESLAQLYEQQFGGKARGRFRVSMKHMRLLTGRRRVTGDLILKISEELYEFGFVLIDLEDFFVILAQRTFKNYRRVSDACLMSLEEEEIPKAPQLV